MTSGLPDGSVVVVDTGFIVHNDRPIRSCADSSPNLRWRGVPDRDVDEHQARRDRGGVRRWPRCDRFPGAAPPIGAPGLPRPPGVRRFNRLATKFFGDQRRGRPEDIRRFHYRARLPACIRRTGMPFRSSRVSGRPYRSGANHPARHLHFPAAPRHARDWELSQWLTVEGGSRTYVDALATRLDDVRVATPVRRIMRRGTVWRSWTRPAAGHTTGSSSPPTRTRPSTCSPMPHHWKRTSRSHSVLRQRNSAPPGPHASATHAGVRSSWNYLGRCPRRQRLS